MCGAVYSAHVFADFPGQYDYNCNIDEIYIYIVKNWSQKDFSLEDFILNICSISVTFQAISKYQNDHVLCWLQLEVYFIYDSGVI